jgi:hypothetical protein
MAWVDDVGLPEPICDRMAEERRLGTMELEGSFCTRVGEDECVARIQHPGEERPVGGKEVCVHLALDDSEHLGDARVRVCRVVDPVRQAPG